jgi:hypothetical protein
VLEDFSRRVMPCVRYSLSEVGELIHPHIQLPRDHRLTVAQDVERERAA